MQRESLVAPAGQLGIHVRRSGTRPASIFREVIRHALPLTRSREVNIYRLRNSLNVWRGLWRFLVAWFVGVPAFVGSVYATVKRSDGTIVPLGMISMRVVTDNGVGYIVDAFQNSVELEDMKYHGFGTGTNAEAANNTALQTELTTQYTTNNTRPTGSTTEGATGNIYRTVATVTPDAAVAITEHGVFNQASNAGGVLLDRSVFSAVNLNGSGDAMQTTYELTFTSGS